MQDELQPVILGVADCIEGDFSEEQYKKWSLEEKYFSLLSESIDRILKFIGTDRNQFQGLVTDFVSMEAKALGRGGYSHTLKNGNTLGFSGFASHEIDIGGASVGGAIGQAYSIVKSNPDAVVLVAGADVPKSAFRSVSDLKRLTEMVCHPNHEIPYGSTLIGFYSMLANRLMLDGKIETNAWEEITTFFRNCAISNPRAFSYQKELTEKQLKKSLAGNYSAPMIAIVTDHGFASVITSFGKKQELQAKGIWKKEARSVFISGIGQAAHTEYFYLKDSLKSPAALAAERAFSISGKERKEVQYAWIYDCFPGMLVSQSSQYFGVPAREVANLLKKGKISNGEFTIPINAGGGILNYQAAMSLSGATGLVDVLSQYDLSVSPVPQLVKNPTLSLLGGNGGIDSINTVVLFSTSLSEKKPNPIKIPSYLKVANTDAMPGEQGTIIASTTVYFNPGGEKKPPYVLVLVETESGKMKLTNLFQNAETELKTDEGIESGSTKVRLVMIQNLLQSVLV